MASVVFNVMSIVEIVILQEIVLWSWTGPLFLRKLCFARGRKRHVNGSYGLHMTKTALASKVRVA